MSACVPILLLGAIGAGGEHELVREWNVTAGQLTWKLFLIFFFVFLNGFFVAAEFAIVKVRASQLDTMADMGGKSAQLSRHITENLDAYLSATQLGITLASLALGWLGEPFVSRIVQPLFFQLGVPEAWVSGVSFALAFTFITFLHVVLGELLPKSLAIRKSLATTLVVSRPLRFFRWLFNLPIWALNGTANWLLRLVFRIDPVKEHELIHSAEELRILVEETEKGEDVTDTEREILINALELNDLAVRDIMTPRNDVVTLDMEKSFEENLAVAVRSKHTRFPLVESHLDNAVGLIHIKDLLGLMHSGEQDLMSIRKELTPVPELMPLDKLLSTFLERHAHMCLVVDEFGGALGLVMLDDVLEELVGEIQDEFDEDEVAFRRESASSFVVAGSLTLHELGDFTDLSLENPDVSTVGGYVTHVIGHLPKVGERAFMQGYEATVVRADDRSVQEVRFRNVTGRSGATDSTPVAVSVRDQTDGTGPAK